MYETPDSVSFDLLLSAFLTEDGPDLLSVLGVVYVCLVMSTFDAEILIQQIGVSTLLRVVCAQRLLWKGRV